MRPPASETENRTHGAKKIGPGQYSDFFNRIGQSRPIAVRQTEGAARGWHDAKLDQRHGQQLRQVRKH